MTLRRPELVVYAAAALIAALAGASLVTDPRAVKLLLALPVLALALTVRPERILVAWLFAAPLVQGAAAGDHAGHLFYTGFFLLPPLILVARVARDGIRPGRIGLIDVLPAAYLGYVLVSARVFQSELAYTETSLRAVYSIVGMGVIAYYLVAFARLPRGFPVVAVQALLWAGVLVAAFALVDAATSWDVWNSVVEGRVDRATSTFKSSFDMATYLGMMTAFAIAALLWKAPRQLRLPAIAVVALSIPALFFTYSRGPIIAAGVVAVLLTLVARRTRWRTVVTVAAAGAVLYASWGVISATGIYGERLSVTSTVTDRLVVEQVSYELIQQRPVFGWGYQTFDQAKLSVPTRHQRRVEETTSHNTFTRVLVELGIVGLALLVLPWAVILRRAVTAVQRGAAEAWLVGGCVGAVAVYTLGAMDYDTRFFPLVTALPWVAVGLARRALADESSSP